MTPRIVLLALLACGAPAIPSPEPVPPEPNRCAYAGQEECFCRDLGFVCEPATCTHRSVYGKRCEALWGCGVGGVEACRTVCAWLDFDGGAPCDGGSP